MTKMDVKKLIELLSTLALVIKQIKNGKASESVLGELYYLARHQENNTCFNFRFQSFDF